MSTDNIDSYKIINSFNNCYFKQKKKILNKINRKLIKINKYFLEKGKKEEPLTVLQNGKLASTYIPSSFPN